MLNITKYGQITLSLLISTSPLLGDGIEGWSLDIGGDYTWMSFSTPPTYSGSTGGLTGKITYQKSDAVFVEARSTYNLGTLSSSLNSAKDYEWYSELVSGYCLSAGSHWNITPYIGIGVDFLRDNHRAYPSIPAISLHYRIYYALFGLQARYSWKDWYVGFQAEGLPTFDQFLEIKGLPGAAWTLKSRVGADAKFPVGRKLCDHIWMELAPYYRFLPVGSSGVLGLPHRNINEWGGVLNFRFVL